MNEKYINVKCNEKRQNYRSVLEEYSKINKIYPLSWKLQDRYKCINLLLFITGPASHWPHPLESRCEMPAGVWSLGWPGFRDTRPRHSRVTRHSSRHYTRPPSPHTLALVTTEQMLLTSPRVHTKIPRCLGVFIKRLI